MCSILKHSIEDVHEQPKYQNIAYLWHQENSKQTMTIHTPQTNEKQINQLPLSQNGNAVLDKPY